MNRKLRRAEARRENAPASSPLFALAVARHQAGALPEAERLYRQVLAAEPDHAETHHYLGVLAFQVGRSDIAIAMIARAIALKSHLPAFHDSLGLALAHQGRADEAAASHRRALALDPSLAEAHVNLGNVLKDQGRPEEAIACYRKALALRPAFAIAHNNLAGALKDQGKPAEAEASCRRALALNPDYPEAHSNLGVALTDLNRLDEAIASFQRALNLRPGYAEAYFNLATTLRQLGNLADAAASYGRALSLKPDFGKAHNNLGNVLEEQGLISDAAICYERALAINPNDAEAHNNLAGLLKDQGRLSEAMESYQRALTLKPDYHEAHSNLLLCQQYSNAISDADLLASARRFGAKLARSSPARIFANDRAPARRLRIGYVSGDFRRHPVGYFLARVLEAHDKNAVEIFCYSNHAKADDMSARLSAAADHWRAIAGLSDSDAAGLIARDAIDILVDLSGHTAKNRLPLFALRPAPVQASWLGYFGATGLDAIDYLMMDEAGVPHGQERWYNEALVRLPHGRFCYAPPDYAPAPVDPPALLRGAITFGSFNNIAKLGPDVVNLWAEVLRTTPRSRLLLKWQSLDDANQRRRIADAFMSVGVAGDRLELRGFSPHADMLAQYGDIDIALDPFPFGGGLTTCEALWMGAPVLTMPGSRPAARQASGFLAQLGLTQCVATSPGDYVGRAAALAADLDRLTLLRRSLRPRMAGSPLCDGALFTPTLEVAFRTMWRRWCAGLPAEAFDAPLAA
jgi:protein O-GlcNAc transferase